VSKCADIKKSGNHQNREVLIYDILACTKSENRLVEKLTKLDGIKSHLKYTEVELNLNENN
jgi:hypothetical protein